MRRPAKQIIPPLNRSPLRVTREQVQENHRRIVENAARLVRERGIENTAVADVMAAAGLTHGGFYRHFQGKDDLVAAAVRQAFDEIAQRLEKGTAQRGASDAATRYQKDYLSRQHRDDPGIGCPVAALGSEVARAPEAVRKVFGAGVERIVSLLSAAVGGDDEARRRMAMLVGAVVIARASDAQTSARVLEAVRKALDGSVS